MMQPERPRVLTPTTPLPPPTTSSPAPTSTVSDNKPVDELSIFSIIVMLFLFLGSALFVYFQYYLLFGKKNI